MNESWFDDELDFLTWCDHEMRRLRLSLGACGQDVYTSSGRRGFDAKYPTREAAWLAFKLEQEEATNA